MATDHISLEGTRLAVCAADRALEPYQRDLAARAKKDRYLDSKHAANPVLDLWWRSYQAWRLSPAVYATRLTGDRTRVLIDLTNIASRLTPAGRDALHALFEEVGGIRKRSRRPGPRQ